MSMIPEVKCRRCGETFSSLRSRCPNCGTRRVTQSARTPSATPGTVRGTASYERAAANTKWQMIFGLILVVAVILAVIVMVSTSLDGSEGGKVKATPTPEVTASAPVIETAPTPPPTPTPSVERVVIRYNQDEKTEFTMRMGDAPVTINAIPYPLTIDSYDIKWTTGDEDVLKITVNEDGTCTCEIVGTIAGGVKVKAEIFGVVGECIVYCTN